MEDQSFRSSTYPVGAGPEVSVTAEQPKTFVNTAPETSKTPTPKPVPPLPALTDKDLELSHETEILKETWATPNYPLEGLPEAVQKAINCVAKGRNVPVAYCLPAALAACSTALGSAVDIEAAGYTNKANLWMMVVGNSGTNKSQPLNDLMKPLEEMDLNLSAAYEREYDEKKAAFEALNEKKGRSSATFEPPVCHQILVKDLTAEARFDALKANPHGLCMQRDELKAFVDDLNRYGKSGEISDLLSVYDGKMIKRERKTSGMSYVDSPYMTMVGTIQPAMLAPTFGGPTSRFTHSGFLPRFDIFYPEANVQEVYRSEQLDLEVMRDYYAMIKWIWRRCWGGQKVKVRMTQRQTVEIHEQFFYNTAILKGANTSDYEKAVISKLRIKVLKLAGIAAAMAALVADGNQAADPTKPVECEITPMQMLWAVDLCFTLFDNQRHAFSEIGGGTVVTDAGLATKKATIQAIRQFYPDFSVTHLAAALHIDRSTIYSALR